jgi:chaperone modulatory protein CbpM
MITIETLCVTISGLDRAEVERWIANAWIRPDRAGAEWTFREIDIARVRLIQEMRMEMRVDEEAMPVVLSLLDQLYEARRRLGTLREVLIEAAPADVRERVLRVLES